LLVQDLLSLKKEVPWASEETISSENILPKTTLPAPRVKQALRQAKEDLSALHRLLSE
jgi:hypothetical protein